MDLDDVPAVMFDRVRAVCLALPEAFEETSWVGTRWKVRTRTFAHLVLIERGRPPMYARAVGTDGPVVALTFRTHDPEFFKQADRGRPFFYAGFGRDEVGMVLSANTDWAEVAELLTESFCVLAPTRLAALVEIA